MSGPKVTYTGSGTEPLRSNEKTLASAPAAANRSAGSPAGGTTNTRGKFMVLAAKAAKMASGGGANATPDGVQSFTATVRK